MCDLILLASRLSLLQFHRRRKARLVERVPMGMSILQPILQILQYHSTTEAVRPVLDRFAETLGRAGLEAHAEVMHSASNTGALFVEKLLAGEDSLGDINVVYKLDIEHW